MKVECKRIMSLLLIVIDAKNYREPGRPKKSFGERNDVIAQAWHLGLLSDTWTSSRRSLLSLSILSRGQPVGKVSNISKASITSSLSVHALPRLFPPWGALLVHLVSRSPAKLVALPIHEMVSVYICFTASVPFTTITY